MDDSNFVPSCWETEDDVLEDLKKLDEYSNRNVNNLPDQVDDTKTESACCEEAKENITEMTTEGAKKARMKRFKESIRILKSKPEGAPIKKNIFEKN